MPAGAGCWMVRSCLAGNPHRPQADTPPASARLQAPRFSPRISGAEHDVGPSVPCAPSCPGPEQGSRPGAPPCASSRCGRQQRAPRSGGRGRPAAARRALSSPGCTRLPPAQRGRPATEGRRVRRREQSSSREGKHLLFAGGRLCRQQRVPTWAVRSGCSPCCLSDWKGGMTSATARSSTLRWG